MGEQKGVLILSNEYKSSSAGISVKKESSYKTASLGKSWRGFVVCILCMSYFSQWLVYQLISSLNTRTAHKERNISKQTASKVSKNQILFFKNIYNIYHTLLGALSVNALSAVVDPKTSTASWLYLPPFCRFLFLLFTLGAKCVILGEYGIKRNYLSIEKGIERLKSLEITKQKFFVEKTKVLY